MLTVMREGSVTLAAPRGSFTVGEAFVYNKDRAAFPRSIIAAEDPRPLSVSTVYLLLFLTELVPKLIDKLMYSISF